MAAATNEPSMEDILSSIKKIIAEDSAKPQGFTRTRARAVEEAVEVEDADADSSVADAEIAEVDDEILELTQLELTQSAPADMPTFEQPAIAEAASSEAQIVSSVAVEASRHALASLSKMVVKPDVAGSDTLEGMVRDMLKPMLKDWLDANLPEIVERMVAQEVARISGRSV